MPLFDTSRKSGGAAEARLVKDQAAWLVTVSPDGVPQPSPIWYLWDGETFLIYSEPNKPKIRNIQANSRVALHLDGDRAGRDIVVVEGTAEIGGPPADTIPAYVQKYSEGFKRIGMDAAKFAAAYAVPIRVRPDRTRAWLVTNPND